MFENMPPEGWLTVAGLLLLVCFLCAIVIGQNREIDAGDSRRERLEQQIEWLTSRHEEAEHTPKTIEWVPDPSCEPSAAMPDEWLRLVSPPAPSASCIRCGQPGCPHPVLTDAAAYV